MLRFRFLAELFLKETALNDMSLVKETYAVSIDYRAVLIVEAIVLTRFDSKYVETVFLGVMDV